MGGSFRMARANRDPLFLSTGETHTALSNNGVKAIWQAHDEVVDIRGFRCHFNFYLRRVQLAVGDILSDCSVKQERLLWNKTNLTP